MPLRFPFGSRLWGGGRRSSRGREQVRRCSLGRIASHGVSMPSNSIGRQSASTENGAAGRRLCIGHLAHRFAAQRKSSFDVCGAKGVSLCPGQRRKNVDLTGKVLQTPGTGWKSRKRFETTMAFRAMPKMSNKLMIQVFGPFRRDQFVAALDAIDSE
jgi:hypothetical protein